MAKCDCIEFLCSRRAMQCNHNSSLDWPLWLAINKCWWLVTIYKSLYAYICILTCEHPYNDNSNTYCCIYVADNKEQPVLNQHFCYCWLLLRLSPSIPFYSQCAFVYFPFLQFFSFVFITTLIKLLQQLTWQNLENSCGMTKLVSLLLPLVIRAVINWLILCIAGIFWKAELMRYYSISDSSCFLVLLIFVLFTKYLFSCSSYCCSF